MTAPINSDSGNTAEAAYNEMPIPTEPGFPSPQRGRGARGEGDREFFGICYPCHAQPTSLENNLPSSVEEGMPGPTATAGVVGVPCSSATDRTTPTAARRAAVPLLIQGGDSSLVSSNVAPHGGMKTSLALEARMTQRLMPPHPQPLSRVGARGAEGSILSPIKWRLAAVLTRARTFGARIPVACLCMILFLPSPAVLAQAKKADKAGEPAPSSKPQPAAERVGHVQKVFAIKHADVEAIARTLSVFPVPVHPNRELRVIGVSAPAALMPTIEETIRRLDVPSAAPKNVELTVYLLLASDQESGSVVAELEGVVKQLRTTFAFKGVRTIDTLVVRSRDKQSADVKGLARFDTEIPNPSTYRFGYKAATILSDEKGRSIRLDGLRFSAQIVVKRQSEAASSVFGYDALDAGFGTDVDVREGQKVVVGKAAVGGTNSALILVITAKVLE